MAFLSRQVYRLSMVASLPQAQCQRQCSRRLISEAGRLVEPAAEQPLRQKNEAVSHWRTTDSHL